MSGDVYVTIPKTMELRMIRYSLVCRGRRGKTIAVATTLVDAVDCPKEEIAEVPGRTSDIAWHLSS